MASERRQQILLGALAVVLVLAVAYNFWPSTAGGPGPTSNRNGTTRAQRGAPPLTAPDVHLDALTAERPKPEDAERNLFKFKPQAVPAPPYLSFGVHTGRCRGISALKSPRLGHFVHRPRSTSATATVPQSLA